MRNIDETFKRGRILAAFKQRMRDGKWPAGGRLPTRTELVKKFKLSPVTLQHVIDQLMREGFVESRGRDGTFAAAVPPFARNFGFVIRGVNDERHAWGHYWRVLEAEATKAFAGTAHHPLFYYGIDQPFSADVERLRKDVEAHTLRGVFFSNQPDFLVNSPLLSQKHTPLVAVGGKKDSIEKLSVLSLGTERFFEIATKQVAAAGRKRVALITPWEDPRQHLPEFNRWAVKHGLQTHPRWCQYAPHSAGGRLWAAHAVEAIAAGTPRPDALIIYDDNLIESSMAGIQAAGWSVPSECLVVAHANFPWPIASPCPIIRIGVDIREVVQAAIAEIERRQHGAPPQRLGVQLHTRNEIQQ